MSDVLLLSAEVRSCVHDNQIRLLNVTVLKSICLKSCQPCCVSFEKFVTKIQLYDKQEITPWKVKSSRTFWQGTLFLETKVIIHHSCLFIACRGFLYSFLPIYIQSHNWKITFHTILNLCQRTFCIFRLVKTFVVHPTSIITEGFATATKQHHFFIIYHNNLN